MHENYDLEQLLELVQTRQFRRLRELLVNMNEVDIAEFLDELGPEETVLVFRLLPSVHVLLLHDGMGHTESLHLTTDTDSCNTLPNVHGIRILHFHSHLQ